jgi:hypothetical protein
MTKTKTVGRSKTSQITFESYRQAINNRMSAGHDVSKLTERLTYLVRTLKK